MTGLLVSVRNAEEAAAALAGGAAIIDVKEPDRGALGAADPAVWQEVLRVVGGRVPVSAALGELFDEKQIADWRSMAGKTAGLAFVKVGLAGAARASDWIDRWLSVRESLPRGVALVAAAYADWRHCAAPDPRQVQQTCAAAGCRHFLLDTFDKSLGTLVDHMSLDELSSFVARGRALAGTVVLAGSLSRAVIAELLPLAPSYFAVRGAACGGDRCGRIEAQLVRALVDALTPISPRSAARARKVLRNA